ncbi:hypothetical protein DL93DRAFT_2095227 [Clavulina sp. PMI_390]|nr:hypothetical protein DL93DRAFT_2095227 [Clavulina sp. PMI_390]
MFDTFCALRRPLIITAASRSRPTNGFRHIRLEGKGVSGMWCLCALPVSDARVLDATMMKSPSGEAPIDDRERVPLSLVPLPPPAPRLVPRAREQMLRLRPLCGLKNQALEEQGAQIHILILILPSGEIHTIPLLRKMTGERITPLLLLLLLRTKRLVILLLLHATPPPNPIPSHLYPSHERIKS